MLLLIGVIYSLEAIMYAVLELKYCERCGGLWLRALGTDEVYCASCILKLAEFPVFHRRGALPDAPVPDPEDGQVTIEELLGWCGPGGNA